MAKLNVAIADDNERILTMLDEVLTADDDITVVGTARNGEQAYEMILDKKPDVVLLDLVMPRCIVCNLIDACSLIISKRLIQCKKLRNDRLIRIDSVYRITVMV